MTEPRLCTRCGQRPAYVSPKGKQQSWCVQCYGARRRELKAEQRADLPTERPEPKPPAEPKPFRKSPAQRALDAAQARRQRAIAEGRIHVVADIHYAKELSWTVCSCGERFEGRDRTRLAARFNEHARQANGRRGSAWDDDEDEAGAA